MLIRGKIPFVYDIEIFPNFFSCAIKNTESGNRVVYEISSRKNDLPLIPKLFLNKKAIFVTYNGIHYDNPIISYIIINYPRLIKMPVWLITQELKEFSDLIINSTTSKSWNKYKFANLFDGLDLLTMMFATKLRCGLKELQVTMQYPNVREYEGDFNSYLPESEYDNVISYNNNDVDSTEELMHRLQGEIELRLGIENTLGVNVLNEDGVNLGVEIIKHNYLKETGKTWSQIKDLRTSCHELDLKDVLFDFIKFETPELKQLHKELLKTHLNLDQERDPKNTNKFKKTVYIDDLEITYSLGGIHTKNKPEIYKTDDEWVIIDSDCALDWRTLNFLNCRNSLKLFLQQILVIMIVANIVMNIRV